MTLESDLKNFKKRLNYSLRQQAQEYRELRDQDLEAINWRETLGAKVQTPFYMYIRERINTLPKSGRSYLELIAQLQDQWVNETMETRERYQRMSISHNKNSLSQLPAFTDLEDPINQRQAETLQNIQLLKSCQGVDRIFRVTHVGENATVLRRREQKQAEKDAYPDRLDFSTNHVDHQMKMFQLRKLASGAQQANQEPIRLIKRDQRTAEQVMLKRRRKLTEKPRSRGVPIRHF